jgi:phosphatidylglycerol:prolipoprotein diacylglycerol transferase
LNNGIVINIDPVVLRLGYLEIRWYSVIVMLAILAAIGMAIYEGKKKGVSSAQIISLAPWVVAGGMVGARLFHVIDRWKYYAGNPLQIFTVQQGGLAIWGGLAGGFIAVIIFAKLKKISLGCLADTMVPALLVAEVIGRFACIINGDAAGGATNLPWGFIYTHPGALIPGDLFGVPTHPYPVYEMLWNLAGLTMALRLRRYLKTDGLLFLTYLSFYAIGRFILTFVRQENVWFWGLQEAQVIAIAILMASAGVTIYTFRKSKIDMPLDTSNAR